MLWLRHMLHIFSSSAELYQACRKPSNPIVTFKCKLGLIKKCKRYSLTLEPTGFYWFICLRNLMPPMGKRGPKVYLNAYLNYVARGWRRTLALGCGIWRGNIYISLSFRMRCFIISLMIFTLWTSPQNN